MSNKLKTKEETIEINQLYSKEESENYSYFLTENSIINQQKIPPKNSLSELVFQNKITEIKKILKKGSVDIDARDSSGTTASWTPLYWAVKCRNIDCIKLLLENGANINIMVNDLEECSGNVLDLATVRNDVEIESLLREFLEKEEQIAGNGFTAIRTKLRGKAPSFNFNSYTNTNTKK